MKILLVEDDLLLRKMLAITLEKKGYTVINCADGKEALIKFDQENPDILITKILLPFLSGLEVIKYAKNKKEALVAIVISAIGKEKTKEEAYQLGADDYVMKPLDLNDLSVRIEQLLETKAVFLAKKAMEKKMTEHIEKVFEKKMTIRVEKEIPNRRSLTFFH